MLRSRQETRCAESRAHILDAAVRLLAERGCAGATVGRIAETAGLSTAAVYWHFKDKSGLFRAVAHHIKETWVARVKADTLAESTGRARLERLIESHLRWIASDDPHLRAYVLLGLEARGLGEIAAAEFMNELGRMYRAFIAQLITEGQIDGSLGMNAAPAEAGSVLACALLGAIVQRAAVGERADAAAIGHAVIHGLLA